MFIAENSNKKGKFMCFSAIEKIIVIVLCYGYTQTWQCDYLHFLIEAWEKPPISRISIREQCRKNEELVSVPYFGTNTLCLKNDELIWRTEKCYTEGEEYPEEKFRNIQVFEGHKKICVSRELAYERVNSF